MRWNEGRLAVAMVLAGLGSATGAGQTTSPEPVRPPPGAPPAEAPVFTPQQITALNSLDTAIRLYEADLARTTDLGQRARSEALFDIFKSRRDALRRQRFDQAKYDDLRFDLNVEYQRLGQLLAAPRTPAAAKQIKGERRLEIPDLRLVMMPIAPGTFLMGRPQGLPENSPGEEPPTRVAFSQSFWIGATEVTAAQWRRFVEATGYRADRAGSSPRTAPGTANDDLPVTGVSAADAEAFCAWLTKREREANRLPAGHVYALPTEPQWEYACRAGNRGPDPDNLDDQVWHAGNSGGTLHAVGTKRPNQWGLYDMQGNAAEWCVAWLDHYPGGTVTDPRELGGVTRRTRGGSVRALSGAGTGSRVRGTANGLQPPDDVGFRVALVPVH